MPGMVPYITDGLTRHDRCQLGRATSHHGPTTRANSEGWFEPGLSDRGSRHLLKLRHQRPVRMGAVADSCDADIRPINL